MLDIVYMLFLGHMVWAYIFAKMFRRDINISLVMLLGILPDIDLLFNNIAHRSITHSIPVITLLFIPFLVIYKKRVLPYYIAITQHIFFGDLIVGKTQLFWPFGPAIGLRFKLTSIENIMIEGIGLAIFLILFIKDRKKILGSNNIMILIPLISLLLLPLATFIYGISEEEHKFSNVTNNSLIGIIIALHIILAVIFLIIAANSIKRNAYIKDKFPKFRKK